jgi:hypothetical protein
MIMYVCAFCREAHAFGFCHDRTDLRVMPDGTWICADCYDDGAEALGPWESLPHPPKYVPVECQDLIEAIRSAPPNSGRPASELRHEMAIAVSLRARCERLTEALRWYAEDGSATERFYIVDANGERITNFASFGARARDALEAEGER